MFQSYPRTQLDLGAASALDFSQKLVTGCPGHWYDVFLLFYLNLHYHVNEYEHALFWWVKGKIGFMKIRSTLLH